MREGVANEQQKVSKTICCLFFSSALSTSSSPVLSTHASVRQFVLSGVDWARGWLRVSRAEIAGRCGVKGSKTNQVNNQQHTLTHTQRVGHTRTHRHWSRHSVKVNVTAHLIARTARIRRSSLVAPCCFRMPKSPLPLAIVDKRNFLHRHLLGFLASPRFR